MKRLLFVVLLSLSACFEAQSGGPGAPGTDLGSPPADTSSPKGDGGEVGLDTNPPDTAGPTTPCTTDGQCQDMVSANKCLGPFRCLNWECIPDPAQSVTCLETGDPCQENSCNPSSGACEITMNDSCVCKPVGNLKCGQVKEFSTADNGATNVLKNYPCGPEGGDGSERVWIFETDVAQSVKIALSSEELSGVWAVGYDGTNCNTVSCIAGGQKGAAFMAQPGFKYAIIVEHPLSGAVFAKLSTYCGLEVEIDCDDGVDDDLDGLVDCADPSCSNKDGCPPAFESSCDDGVDNDEDGLVDCADAECSQDPWCTETCTVNFDAECGTKDGRVTADFAKDISNYSCGPEAGGYEVIYRFSSNMTNQVTVTLKSGVESMGMYALLEQGKGCMPSGCIAYGKSVLIFPNDPGSITYVVVDSAKNSGGYYDIEFQCN